MGWALPALFLPHFLGVSGEICGGASGWIMSCVGPEILLQFAKERMATLQKEMDKFQGSMFRYMLRVSPLFPKWFVNYATAMIGMPFQYFLVASTLAIQLAACMSIAIGMLRDVGESVLDVVKMAKRGTMMATTMALLSFAIDSGNDWSKGLDRVKGWWKHLQKAATGKE